MIGIKRDRYGFRAYVKRGGRQREKRYPVGTALKVMQDWRKEAFAALKTPASRPMPATDTLADDLASYLAQVAAMPTILQRTAHLNAWVAALGPTRTRASITAADIRTVLHGWRARWGPATCNKRRAALMHLWSVLDGKGASNPVRDVPKFRVADPLPRGQDPRTVDAALTRAPRCRSRACCRVLLWTGLRPVELAHAQPEDLDLRRRTLIVRTAKGGRVRTVPLTTQAVDAWKEFDAADAWGRVPQAAPLNRWLKDRTKLAMRVYDLRHSYGTALARSQTRLDVIGALMGHSTLELTKRYTLAAVTPDAKAATLRLGSAGRTAGSRKTRGMSSKSA